jgi:hypothetical protein
LCRIIDDRSKLIGPNPIRTLDYKITHCMRDILLHPALPAVLEPIGALRYSDPPGKRLAA